MKYYMVSLIDHFSLLEKNTKEHTKTLKGEGNIILYCCCYYYYSRHIGPLIGVVVNAFALAIAVNGEANQQKENYTSNTTQSNGQSCIIISRDNLCRETTFVNFRNVKEGDIFVKSYVQTEIHVARNIAVVSNNSRNRFQTKLGMLIRCCKVRIYCKASNLQSVERSQVCQSLR